MDFFVFVKNLLILWEHMGLKSSKIVISIDSWKLILRLIWTLHLQSLKFYIFYLQLYKSNFAWFSLSRFGDFFKFLATNSIEKVAICYLMLFLVIFEKHQFSIKNCYSCCDYFLSNVWQNSATFYSNIWSLWLNFMDWANFIDCRLTTFEEEETEDGTGIGGLWPKDS